MNKILRVITPPKKINIYKLALIFILICNSQSNSQQQMKIMMYNLLNYPSADTNIRNPYFRTIVSSVNPDILVVCEINTQAGVNAFLNNVLNYNTVTYSAGVFIDGGFDTENAIFYKTSKFNFISNIPIKTLVRDINEFKIEDKVYHDTLRLYGVHLKANLQDSLERAAEADSLRKKTNQLPQGTDFIVLGDFNIYGATESAYKKLVKDNVNDDGNFVDPFNMPGIWNNVSYSQYHTQSTRTRSFGNGATGGLDDRFDMILYSNAVKNSGGIKFIPGTYTAYGNDGNHYNDSINQIPNNAVSQTIANALHNASDHLPVYATFEFGNETVMNLKVIPEGLYNAFSNQLMRKDTVKVYLRKITSPYAVADSTSGVVDTLTFTSNLKFRFANTSSYYIEVKHINSIETWSKSGGIQYTIDSLINYDFTNSVSQAYGNNLIQKGSKYCIYAGDENQDGIVDSEDMINTYNAAENLSSGYLSADMNGDYFVDASDITIVYNNSINAISKIVP